MGLSDVCGSGKRSLPGKTSGKSEPKTPLSKGERFKRAWDRRKAVETTRPLARGTWVVRNAASELVVRARMPPRKRRRANRKCLGALAPVEAYLVDRREIRTLSNPDRPHVEIKIVVMLRACLPIQDLRQKTAAHPERTEIEHAAISRGDL